MIFTFGDVIVDIAVKAFGSLSFGSDVPGRIHLGGGGSAANFAAWAASLGSAVTLLAKAGDDFAAGYLERELALPNLRAFIIREKTLQTGTILVFVDASGERTMVTDRGANLHLARTDFSTSMLEGCSHVHFTGYSLFQSECLVDTTTYILEEARRKVGSISVDPSSFALLNEFGATRFLEKTEGIDYLFPNLDEAACLTGKREPQDMVRVLLRTYNNVVLTLGAQGCLLGTRAGITHVPTQAVRAVDTTGAGDSFAAGFLHMVLAKHDPLVSARFANSIAGECIKTSGARPKQRSSNHV